MLTSIKKIRINAPIEWILLPLPFLAVGIVAVTILTKRIIVPPLFNWGLAVFALAAISLLAGGYMSRRFSKFLWWCGIVIVASGICFYLSPQFESKLMLRFSMSVGLIVFYSVFIAIFTSTAEK